MLFIFVLPPQHKTMLSLIWMRARWFSSAVTFDWLTYLLTVTENLHDHLIVVRLWIKNVARSEDGWPVIRTFFLKEFVQCLRPETDSSSPEISQNYRSKQSTENNNAKTRVRLKLQVVQCFFFGLVWIFPRHFYRYFENLKWTKFEHIFLLFLQVQIESISSPLRPSLRFTPHSKSQIQFDPIIRYTYALHTTPHLTWGNYISSKWITCTKRVEGDCWWRKNDLKSTCSGRGQRANLGITSECQAKREENKSSRIVNDN